MGRTIKTFYFMNFLHGLGEAAKYIATGARDHKKGSTQLG